MPSVRSNALKAHTKSYVLLSPITPTDFTGSNAANACQIFLYKPFFFNSLIKISSAFCKILILLLLIEPKILIASPGPGKGCLEI